MSGSAPRADRERARADADEARAEELRWAEVASRSDAGAWKSRFKACRGRLSEAVEETKEARRAARGRAFLAGRSGAPGDAPLRSRHRVEREQQDRGAAQGSRPAAQGPDGTGGPRGCGRPAGRHTALEQSPDQKDTIRTLRKDITRLNNEVVRRDKRILQLNKRLDREKQSTETIRETARKLSSESLRLHREVRILGHSEARARSLSDEVFWLRHALEVSQGREGEVEGPPRQAPGGRGDAVEASVRRGLLLTAEQRCPTRGGRAVRSRRRKNAPPMVPCLFLARGGGCTAWSSMRRFGWRLSMRG